MATSSPASAHPSPLGGYARQYARMVRHLHAASPAAADRELAEDRFITFFLHCWHLKDHVKNDQAIERVIRDRVHTAVHEAPELMLCRDIANGLKHFIYMEGAMTGGSAIVAVAGSSAVYHPMVRKADGSEVRAFEVAWDAYNRWNVILQESGLSIPVT
jgi:hypothetical protein